MWSSRWPWERWWTIKSWLYQYSVNKLFGAKCVGSFIRLGSFTAAPWKRIILPLEFAYDHGHVNSRDHATVNWMFALVDWLITPMTIVLLASGCYCCRKGIWVWLLGSITSESIFWSWNVREINWTDGDDETGLYYVSPARVHFKASARRTRINKSSLTVVCARVQVEGRNCDVQDHLVKMARQTRRYRFT